METIMNENNQQQKEVEMEELQQLLKDVYEATKDIKQEKAEPFDVIGTCIGTQETIHSKFLAELLNPHGSHGLGSAFLKAFYEQIGLKDFHSEGCSVRTEVICEEKGKKKTQEKENEGQRSNGRIDIVIKNSQELVVIENKIYAQDQQRQLQKYDAQMKNKYPKDNAKALLYLTLDGHEASDPGNTSYKRISYKDDILRWLEKCIYIAEGNNAFTKAILVQYQELIKKLTGEHMNPSMKDAVTSAATTNAQNYLAAAYIAQTFNNCHQKIIQEIAEKCNPTKEDSINEKWECKITYPHKDGRFAGFYYTSHKYKFKLFFEFQNPHRGFPYYRDLRYGLHSDNHFKEALKIPQQLLQKDIFESTLPNEKWIITLKPSQEFIHWDAKSFYNKWDLDLKDTKGKFISETSKYIKNLIDIIVYNRELLTPLTK